MGRSVSFPRGSIVMFEDVSWIEDSDDFAFYTDDLKAQAAEIFPSLKPQDAWRGREDHVLMRNRFADFGVSEYCGLAAIWITERDDGAYWDHARPELAARWLKSIAPRFRARFGSHELDGYMSNGEGVYRAKTAA